MKKYYPKGNAAVFIVYLIVFALIINSCKKDAFNSAPTINPKEQTAIVQDAKSWFESKYPGNVNTNQSTQSTNTVNSRKWIEGLNPDWKKTSVYKRNKGTVVEMPLLSGAVSFILNSTNATGASMENNYTKASYIISKDSTGVFNAWFMVLVADTSYVNGDFTKLNKNSFQFKDEQYSGRLLYFTPKGKFLAGWKYENGAITKTLSIDDYTTSQQQTNSTKIKVDLVQTCRNIVLTTVTWQCITVNFDVGDQTFCTPYYTTTSVTECTTTGTGSGGGGGGGGSGGGGTFPNPPTPPDCPPAGGVSYSGKQTNLVPGGGGDDPCTVKPPEDPCDKVRRQKANAELKRQLEDLKTKLNQNYESGYLKLVGSLPQYLTGTPNTLSWNAPQISSLANGSIEYMNHNHYNAPQSVSIFSEDDVKAFYEYIYRGKVANENTFTFSVVTSQGMTYSLLLNNKQEFNAFYNTYLSDATGSILFNGLYNSFISINNTPATNEANLLALINQVHMGVTVMKANADTSNWIVSSYDPITNTITLKNCN